MSLLLLFREGGGSKSADVGFLGLLAIWVGGGGVEAEAEADAAVTGGYTPYSVYDPGQEKRIRAKRQKLRRERDKLRADLTRLVSGEPEEAPERRIEAKGQREPKRAPSVAPSRVVDREAANARALQAVAISARQARLEVIGNELAALAVDFKALQGRVVDDLQRPRENELVMILLMAS